MLLDGRVGRFMKKENFNQNGWSASDGSSRCIKPTSDNATCWCIQGYISKLYPENEVEEILSHVYRNYFNQQIKNMHRFNDENPFEVVHAKVLEMGL